MKTRLTTMIIVLSMLLVLGACSETPKNNTNAPKEIAALTTSDKKVIKKDVVFIAGYDKGSETYYSDATTYFDALGYQIINDSFSLEEIITWLNVNHNNTPYGEIHIVNQGNSLKGMSLETTIDGERVTQASLLECLKKNSLPKLENVLSKNTKLVFHSSELGQNKQLLQILKQTFTANHVPNVYASQYAMVFGGEFQDHYLAKVFYGYYPTANSPGKVDLSKSFRRNYPSEEINWLKALRTAEEEEPGKPFTYQFNIPIRWELKFDTAEETPSFANAYEIMDWVEENEDLAKVIEAYNIPIEKFRWRSVTVGKKLIIKGKTTALCVVKPMMQHNNPLSYVRTDVNNKRFYTKL